VPKAVGQVANLPFFRQIGNLPHKSKAVHDLPQQKQMIGSLPYGTLGTLKGGRESFLCECKEGAVARSPERAKCERAKHALF
jgi:hypothetical protein